MKIRNGFVSNSSSSSFWFGFKGSSLKDLYGAIQSHASAFDLWSYDYRCNSGDVVTAIEETSKWCKEEDYEDPGVVHGSVYNIDHFIQVEEDRLRSENESYAQMSEDYKGDDWCKESHLRCVEEIQKRIAKFESWKENEIEKMVLVSFGDNHGDNCGSVGHCMDYESSRVAMEENDLRITTRNDH